jgi:hypothetical protein
VLQLLQATDDVLQATIYRADMFRDAINLVRDDVDVI